MPIFTAARSAKPVPEEELNIQATFLPTVFNLDAVTYALAPKQASAEFKLRKFVRPISLNALFIK